MHARALSLDVGNRHIGVALTDELGVGAQPLLTLVRKSPRDDFRSLARLVRRYAVAHVVVGLPLHANGAESPQSARTRAFAAELDAHLQAALPPHEIAPPTLELLDERHTTREAHALLDAAGGRRTSAADRRERRAHIDQVAAVLILQAWLERRNGPTLLPDPGEPDYGDPDSSDPE